MKIGLKLAALLPICLTFMLSCKKLHPGSNSNSTSVGCISEGTMTADSLAPSLTQAQLSVIDNLFAQNNLSTAYQQFFWVDSNYFTPPGYNTNVDQVEILSYRWYNNLPVFRWNDNYIFYNGVFQPSLIYTGPAPQLGPFGQSLSSLHTIWLNNFMKVATYGPLGNKPTYPNAGWRDSCLTATPGYIDAAFFDSTVAWQTQLVKAWQVAPTGEPYPMVYVEDSTAAAWPVDIFIP